jgi:hypothetical protein
MGKIEEFESCIVCVCLNFKKKWRWRGPRRRGLERPLIFKKVKFAQYIWQLGWACWRGAIMVQRGTVMRVRQARDVTRGRGRAEMVQYIIQVHEAKWAIYKYSLRWNEKLEHIYGDDCGSLGNHVCNLKVMSRDKNGMDIFRPYSRPNLFRGRSSDLSISESRYSTSDNVSISEYSNHIFIISISNRILSFMVDTIRIRIWIRKEI